MNPIVEKQLPIDEASRDNLNIIRTAIFNDTADSLASQVYNGNLSIGAWEEAMKSEIRALHVATGTIGKGGWDNMTQSDWGRIGAEVKQQYRFLHGFADTIAEKRDNISLAAIQARAHMYGEAGKATAAITEAGEFAGGTRRQPGRFKGLPWFPGDGSTKCLTNCRCRWDLIEIDRTKTTKLIQCTWVVDEAAENCPDCIDRSGHIEMRKVPLDTIVPTTIG
jgi:hypothetical protein